MSFILLMPIAVNLWPGALLAAATGGNWSYKRNSHPFLDMRRSQMGASTTGGTEHKSVLGFHGLQ